MWCMCTHTVPWSMSMSMYMYIHRHSTMYVCMYMYNLCNASNGRKKKEKMKIRVVTYMMKYYYDDSFRISILSYNVFDVDLNLYWKKKKQTYAFGGRIYPRTYWYYEVRTYVCYVLVLAIVIFLSLIFQQVKASRYNGTNEMEIPTTYVRIILVFKILTFRFFFFSIFQI